MSRNLLAPLLIALVALAAVLASIAPDGAGPGVTCDEPYHVFEGKRLVTALRQQGFDFFRPANIEENFNWPTDGPPVQAPLGYWILGWTHYLFDSAPDEKYSLSIPAARFAPAAAFAVLIFMIGVWTARRAGALAGGVASASMAIMPRMFAHAHFAALDMLTTLFFVAAVLAAANAARSGKTRHFVLAGVVWGAAMLMRLHGVLLAPPVIVWLVWRFRRRAIMPVAAWTTAGAATLFIGWPWLWLHPIAHFKQYLATGPYRLPLHVFYWGEVWSDRDVPWHYPWIMFAVTVPLGLLLLGMLGLGSEFIGVWKKRRASPPATRNNINLDEDGGLIGGTMVFMLVLFSWPGVPVYDGVRLFLMVFPLWAIWVGVGAGWLVSRVRETHRAVSVENFLVRFTHPTIVATLICLFIAAQAIGLAIYHPCQLSYYNLLTGGLRGANKLGFETTYWGDAVREPMLSRAARLSDGSPILYAPNLAPFQAPIVGVTSPSISQSGAKLIGEDRSDPASAKQCRYAVIYNRKADPASVLERSKVVFEYRKQGVWLARLIELSAPLDEH